MEGEKKKTIISDVLPQQNCRNNHKIAVEVSAVESLGEGALGRSAFRALGLFSIPRP